MLELLIVIEAFMESVLRPNKQITEASLIVR
jgi:hypothetical protein